MHTERGFDRLVNFSDAVVAIAITLVVLPLVDTARDIGDHTVIGFLGDNRASLLAAALSFIVIGSFWRSHHAVFESMTGYSHSIMSANFVWLAGIVFLPLPTVLLVVTSSHRHAGPLLYIGTMLVSMLALAVVGSLAQRQGLRKADAPRSKLVRWSPVGLMALAFVLSAVVPGASLWPLLLLLLERPLAGVARRREAAITS